MPGPKVAALLALVGILCSACSGIPSQPGVELTRTPGPTLTLTELAFRVIAQAAPLGDHPKEPAYAAIKESTEWDTLASKIPAQALESAKTAMQTASSQQLYLLAFSGVRGTSGYTLSIQSIHLNGDQCTVVVAEMKPAENTIVEPAMTLPYVLVALPFKELPGGKEVAFRFTSPQGGVPSQQEVQIP